MAVEVDATLDLRGHSVPDALGRLRDRIEDGAFLGWRTLHVILGEGPGLHEALLAFLQESPAGRIGRYAQAPIPMGGAQAWVLYY
jgi:dsDNA-specific endonuclease/ATPase MutS2